MKILTLLACATFATVLGSVEVAGAEPVPAPTRGPLVHMVSFKFKSTATAADIQKVEKAFAALKDKIKEIVTYESGTNVSPEGLNKGFTHGFLLTFRSAKDRDTYLHHPDHKEFGSLLGPYLEDVFVIDFWTRKEAP